jgi:hypothetical protein
VVSTQVQQGTEGAFFFFFFFFIDRNVRSVIYPIQNHKNS